MAVSIVSDKQSCLGQRRYRIWLCTSLVVLSVLGGAAAGQVDDGTSVLGGEQAAAPTPTAAVPRMIRIRGTVQDGAGNPLNGTIGITLSLYKDQRGGVALWQESQRVAPDAGGHYSVLLGATKPEGLPLELFASGEARWLGAQPDGQMEQPRILLLSVAYALKAADAETLGGKPLSAFVLAENQSAAAPAVPLVTSGPSGIPSGSGASPISNSGCSSISSDGSAATDQVAKFTAPCAIGGSAIFESGGNVGIGNSSPAGPLDVSGNTFIRGRLLLPAAGPATSSQGTNSNPLDLDAQSFNTTLGTGADYIFRWMAEPTGNDSNNTGATLHLLYGVPASIGETGLSVNRSGIFTFASGQTFPGAGTITGVTAGSGLTGGGTSGSVKLSLLGTCASGQILSWNGTAWACSTPAGGTITGVTAGSGLTGGGSSGSVKLSLLSTCASGQILSWNGTAWACSTPAAGTITGVTAGSGLTGGGSSGSVSLSLLKTCTSGQDLTWNGTAWVCSTPITGVTAGSGLTGGGSSGNINLSLLSTCASGQILSWNGTAWACNTPAAGTITGVTAGSGLTGGGSSGNVSLSLLNTCGAGQVLAWSGTAWVCSTLPSPSGTTNGLAYFSSPSTVTSTTAPTNGQILIGSTGNAPTLGTLTAGANISITNSAGSITIASTGGGGSPTLPLFITGSGHTGGMNPAGANVNDLWGFLLPYNVTTTQLTYYAATLDKTANAYDVGLFDNTGTLVLDLGPTPGTTFASAVGFNTLNWAQGSTTLAAGRYYIGFTTNCTSACAQIETGTGVVSFLINTSAGATTGGALSASVTLPPDSWRTGNQPTLVIH